MQQIYHSDAKTNVNIRPHIQKCSSVTNFVLASLFNVSTQTVSKLKNKGFTKDLPSRPKTIKYALIELETTLVVVQKYLLACFGRGI